MVRWKMLHPPEVVAYSEGEIFSRELADLGRFIYSHFSAKSQRTQKISPTSPELPKKKEFQQ
jgi:hypothetical protein